MIRAAWWTRPRTVAALYVDALGPYPKMASVDAWDAARDARLYAGPWPVVAHPPCGPWGRLRHLSTRDDPQLAIDGAAQVRKFGGVLEHPAGSLLWGAVGLPRPGDAPDAWSGYTIEIQQVEWGHVARKRTWIYLVGVPRSLIPPAPFPGRKPTHWISGRQECSRAARAARDEGRFKGGMAPYGIKICSAQQRRRTPPAFAEWLVGLARLSVGPPPASRGRER